MAWPESPPPEQLTAYEQPMTGYTRLVPGRSGGDVREPEEFCYHDGSRWRLNAGWFYLAELDAWLAANPEPDPEPEPEPDPGDPGEPAEPVPAVVQRVADFLGQGADPTAVALAGQVVPIITAMAAAYTRDQGFTDGQPNEAIAAVVVTASARLMGNPEQVDSVIGGVSIRGGFTGWSLAELFVLNRYRRRAA